MYKIDGWLAAKKTKTEYKKNKVIECHDKKRNIRLSFHPMLSKY